MLTLLVTLDTNQLGAPRVAAIVDVLPDGADVAVVTVSDREKPDGSWRVGLANDRGITASLAPEFGTWGESSWGGTRWHSRASADLKNEALRIISNGSFPPKGARADLTSGDRRQLRDAIIFATHAYDNRHLLITNDVKGFVADGRREGLEELGSTRIMTPTEVLACSRDELARRAEE